MKAVRCCIPPLLFTLVSWAAEPAANPNAVPTFECVGLYWKAPGGAADKACDVSYRAAGDKDWRSALPLWFDAGEYRGSIVHLRPGTAYEIALQLKGSTTRGSLQVQTWSEAFPVGKTIAVPVRSSEPLTVAESGSPEGYVVYAPASNLGAATIDVANKADHCIVVKASFVILRGLTLQNARIHGVLLGDGVHDVVIEECDISGWGRIAEDGWGKDYDAAIYSRSAAVKRVIVQRNRIHHPRSNSNNWQESRPAPGKREPSHPEGPQAVCLWDSEGNHVIRYNTVLSDDAHQYNDIFGAGHNFSTRGFPNRDSDIYGNLLSHCWDDAIESEGANCNVRIWGNYMTDVFVGVACASTSIGPLYVWRNVTGVIRESPSKTSGAFLKTSDKMGGGRIFVFHNTILQPVSATDSKKTLGAVVGLGWGGPMTNVMSRNNILQVTRQSITDRAHCPLNDFDYDLLSAPFLGADNQEQHGFRSVPAYVPSQGLTNGRGAFALVPGSPGFDAGVVIPNYNDGFAGAAPDIGAHESGSAPMEFGADKPRRLASTPLPANSLRPPIQLAAQTWQRWEHTLTSTRTYTNPYADATVRVSYTGPGGRTLRTYGFWDGGDAFRIRCAFPVAGAWQWETECSDTANSGLHRQRGTANVASYEGTNTFYRRGFLKVSDNRRYLVQGDGTPFLWMGDTAWGAPQRASDEEWNDYLADRAAKHFTVIQVGPASEWAGRTDRQGQEPFTDKTCSQWNPAYWQSFEQKLQRANEAGLVVLLVGLMEPVHRYPEADRACLFARNIVARLFGNFVIFSPSFDSNFMPLANEVGRAAREATGVHLVTQHPGTPWDQPTPTFSIQYYDEPYLDFVGVQSGHNGGHLDWCAHHAIEWNLQLYRHEPHKPVINLEAMYDGQGTNGWRAVDARGLGWRTWLSGAVGYTYGAGETGSKRPGGGGAIWKWVTDPDKYDYWKKALQWESAFQMQYLHDFLAAIEWWRLQPAHNLIRNQPEDVRRRIVLAKTAAGDLAVAYLPGSDPIEVDMSVFPAPLAVRWFDPVNGRYTSGKGSVENKATHRFTPPGKGDWVMLLQRLQESGSIEQGGGS